MKIIEASFQNWFVQCIPEDGARISILRFEGQDLLTASPPSFKAPDQFYGEYETRSVYGYDDCFPTVDPCLYPEGDFKCRDHGNLCWKEWKVNVTGNSLVSSVDCTQPDVTFKRTLEFAGNRLSWKFEVVNWSAKKNVFLHVMHPLLPLREIQSVKLPNFTEMATETNSVEPVCKNALEVAKHLLSIVPGGCEMILLKGIEEGLVILGLHNGVNLHFHFDNKMFPTLGIWWNNAGYPDQDGLRRTECAFEPIPGTSSNLYNSFIDKTYLSVDKGKSLCWDVVWEIKNN